MNRHNTEGRRSPPWDQAEKRRYFLPICASERSGLKSDVISRKQTDCTCCLVLMELTTYEFHSTCFFFSLCFCVCFFNFHVLNEIGIYGISCLTHDAVGNRETIIPWWCGDGNVCTCLLRGWDGVIARKHHIAAEFLKKLAWGADVWSLASVSFLFSSILAQDIHINNYIPSWLLFSFSFSLLIRPVHVIWVVWGITQIHKVTLDANTMYSTDVSWGID